MASSVRVMRVVKMTTSFDTCWVGGATGGVYEGEGRGRAIAIAGRARTAVVRLPWQDGLGEWAIYSEGSLY